MGNDDIPSDVMTTERFGTQHAAEKYSRALVGTLKDRREKRCIAQALASLPKGSSILDLPCGTGRMLRELARLGFKPSGADSSEHMVDFARKNAGESGLDLADSDFFVADIFDTGLPDNAFDAVLCNRLLHHFCESDTRRRALRELRRISVGPVIVSFFCSLALDTPLFYLKHAIKRSRPIDRIRSSKPS